MFATMMIPHHRQAIQMSDMIPAKDGTDAAVTDLARQIKDAQAARDHPDERLAGRLGRQPEPLPGQEWTTAAG